MDWIAVIIDNFSKDKLWPSTKRLLSIAFVLIVTSNIFEKNYYPYKLNMWNDYEAHFRYIVDGHFMVPFGIYFLIWISSNYFGTFIFIIINQLISDKFKSKIINISINRNEYKQQANKINNLIEVPVNKNSKKEWFVTVYDQLKRSISKEKYQTLISELEGNKINLQSDFILLIRFVLAIVVIFNSSIQIGIFLSILMILVPIVSTLTIVIKYQFAELLPIALQKLSSEMESYIKETYQKDEN